MSHSMVESLCAEGERDEAPMLYIGEQLGCEIGNPSVPAIDIAVDHKYCQ